MEGWNKRKRVFPLTSSNNAERLASHFELSPAQYLILVFLFFFVCFVAPGDDPVNTSRTWDREISRIVYARCGTCHRQGGTAFSLMTYPEARPWATAIKGEVLQRKMPPWGAVKGFGDFRNDQALSQAQLDLIENWVDGGAPEGDPNDLPPWPTFTPLPAIEHRAGEIVASGDFKFQHPFNLDGFWPKELPPAASPQITVELPDGKIEPLVWLRDYDPKYGHPFLLRTPLLMPPGSVIRGLPAGSSLVLLPAISEHQSARSVHRSDAPPHEKKSN